MADGFWPKDTDKKFYVEGGADLNYILEKAKEKWGSNFQPKMIRISSQYIHTHAIGYDLYDAGDYTKFVLVELAT